MACAAGRSQLGVAAECLLFLCRHGDPTLPARAGWRRVGLIFYFCKKNVGNTGKKKHRSWGFLVFKHGDASVCPGPDAAWCRLNLESSTRGHGTVYFFRRREHRGRRCGHRGRRGHRGLRGLPLFIFILVVCRPPARPPARPQAASRVHQRGGTTAADNSDLSGARAAQAWVWARVAHLPIRAFQTPRLNRAQCADWPGLD